jgi:signal transduction histidine kinase
MRSEIEIEGEEHIRNLAQSLRVGLFLFYKECLINICRHAGATRMSARLVVKADRLALSVSDDGKGMDRRTGEPPPSLRRRARLLGGTLKVETKPSEGTRILFTLATRRFRFFRSPSP